MSPVIEARNLSKKYRSHRALDDASFTVQQGRIVGLIGRNGAGKTTALKAILGLTPYEGSLNVLGRDPASNRDDLMREVSFIADTAVLPKWLRVTQALDYVRGRPSGLPARTRGGLPQDHRNSPWQPRERAVQGHGHASCTSR